MGVSRFHFSHAQVDCLRARCRAIEGKGGEREELRGFFLTH